VASALRARRPGLLSTVLSFSTERAAKEALDQVGALVREVGELQIPMSLLGLSKHGLVETFHFALEPFIGCLILG
jgi:hypothetical protein